MHADVGIVPVEKNPYSDLVHTNKMFEYIALRKPVFISRTKAAEELFGPDNSCLKFFESGNATDFSRCVIELYRFPDIRKKMVENAFSKFQAMSWDLTKEKYVNLFNYSLNN